MVMSMKSYARLLALLFSGTTQMLPLEPGCSLLPGNRNVPHWKFLTSLANRPYHQLPEISIGNLPCSQATPMSSALMPAEFLAM